MALFAMVLLYVFAGTSGEIRIGLNTIDKTGSWVVWNQNKSIQIEATVPGGIYTDLQNAGVLDENLFYRFNDIEYRWVAKHNWIYQTIFDVHSSILNKTAVNLVFFGIDTVGEVYLNGKLLSEVNNMFVRYVFSVKTIIKEKNNTLQVILKSPIYESNRLAEIQAKRYKIPPECTPEKYNGECHVNFLRKMQASFAWDWGPAFPSVGIWKPVQIEAYNLGIIRDVTASADKINVTHWRINATTHIEYSTVALQPSGRISGYLKKENSIIPITSDAGVTNKDESTTNGFIFNCLYYVQDRYIDLWWPNGFGFQPLFNFTITLMLEDGSEFSSKTIQIGFRRIELIQEELQKGKKGLSFYFKINGVPIFAKGSNWIPAHILPEMGYNKNMIRNALESAKEANMNMLRVWGGGVYESDFFYSLADELGILIWQDMMFACSMYPTDEKFLRNVENEIKQQIRRLQHHPSIALWAGNNENEAALAGNWYGTSGNFSLYKNDYLRLYINTIRSVVLENDISRVYISSSPSNGRQSEEEGGIAKNPYDSLYGDVHYYNYFFDGWNDFIYPYTRFASEYGFQSLPSFASISKVTLPEDRKIASEFSEKRQHLMGGNDYMKYLIKKRLPLPDDDGSEEYYKTFIYYSQIFQAMSTKTETEKYRRDRNKLTPNNMGNTMGAMYWQLNDVWQAPSWSSIEFGGKWKILHYYAKKFFSPVLVSPEYTPTHIMSVYLISDLLKDVSNVQLNISVYSWDSFIPLKVISKNVLLNKAMSKNHGTYDVEEILESYKCNKNHCFVYLSVKGPHIFSDNFVYPTSFSNIQNLKKANLTVKISETENPSELKVEVSTDAIAPFVWLETDEEGEFSDNGFTLIKRQTTLKFQNRNNKHINLSNFRSTLTIRSVL